MALDELSELLFELGAHRLDLDHLEVAHRLEGVVSVEHPGDAAAHAGGEVAASLSEDDGAPPGHVLAAVVANAFNDCNVAPRSCARQKRSRRHRPLMYAAPLVAP